MNARVTLGRDRVLDEAVAIADELGLDAVSMRRLADRLGVVPMALYKHVRDKQALVDGMVDRVIETFDVGADGDAARAPGDWRAEALARIRAARQSLAAHPWARRAIETRTSRSAAVLSHMDAVAGAMLAGGLSADLVHHAMHALGNRIWGFSPELFNDPAQAGVAPDAPVPSSGEVAEFAARFPAIVAIATSAAGDDLSGVGAGCDEDAEFEFALALLFDGVERLHAEGWRPSRPR